MRKALSIAIAISLLIATLIVNYVPIRPIQASPDWLTGWSYRKSHIINNATGAGTNYQVQHTLKLFSALPSNAPNNQTIPTYDGSGQAIHPDVVYFPDGWNGYKYWMAMTPYPGGSEAYESPSIVVSNDSSSWVVPPGLTNPIAGPASDTDLLYDASSNQLWCYYRRWNTTNDIIYRKTSSNGISWSTATQVLSGPYAGILSPALVKIGTTYYMWAVNDVNNPNNYINLYSSTDGVSWSSPTQCTLNGTIPGNKIPWHLNVIYLPDTGEYWMLLTVCTPNTSGSTSRICFARSEDGTNWYTMDGYFLSVGASGKWDDAWIYRATCILDGTTLKIWYSARTATAQWHTGYTTATIDNNTGIIIRKARVDLGDIRFTKNDGTTLLNYWKEDKNGFNGVFWVKIPDDLSTTSQTIYVYYGKSDATTTSNGDNTFLFFDDFLGSSLNSSKWGVYGAAGSSVSNSLLNTAGTGEGLVYSKWHPTASGSYAFRYKVGGTGYTSGFSYTIGQQGGETTNTLLDVVAINPYTYYYSGGWTGRILHTNLGITTGDIWDVYYTVGSPTWNVYKNGALAYSPTQSVNCPSAGIGFRTYSTTEYEIVDYVFVREYVSPEPSHGAWGSEESSGGTLQVRCVVASGAKPKIENVNVTIWSGTSIVAQANTNSSGWAKITNLNFATYDIKVYIVKQGGNNKLGEQLSFVFDVNYEQTEVVLNLYYDTINNEYTQTWKA